MPQTQPSKFAPTAPQLAFWHGVQSALQAAGISIAVAGGQYLVTGNINANSLITVLIAAFAGAGSMVWKSIIANPNLIQAIRDTVQEALQEATQITPSWLNADIQKIQQQAKQPAPKPIVMPTPAVLPNNPPAQPAQQPTAGGGLPTEYYSRFRSQVPDMATQGTVPAINPGQSMLGTYNLAQQPYNPVPPAQQNQFNPQQGG